MLLSFQMKKGVNNKARSVIAFLKLSLINQSVERRHVAYRRRQPRVGRIIQVQLYNFTTATAVISQLHVGLKSLPASSKSDLLQAEMLRPACP